MVIGTRGNIKNKRLFFSKMGKMGYDQLLLENTWKFFHDNRKFNLLIGTRNYESLKKVISAVDKQLKKGSVGVEIVRTVKDSGSLDD